MNQSSIEAYAEDDLHSAVHHSIPAHPRTCIAKTRSRPGTADVKLGASVLDLWEASK